MITEKISDAFRENHDILTTAQLTHLGMTKTTIGRLVKGGELIRCGHGMYALPDTIEDDMFLLMQHSRHFVLSHDSALFLNGLSERTPFIHSVTLPSNASAPPAVKGHCIRYYIKPELYPLGLTEKMTTFGNPVRCYNAERTICDLLRSRSRIDNEIVITALKNYAAGSCKDLLLLGQYADSFHVSSLLRRYMEVLL